MKIILSSEYRLIFYLFITLICFCEKTSPIDTAGLQPDMIIKDFTTSSYEEGALAWEISAKESSYYYSENRSIAKDILLKYYENKKVSATVRADTAVISIDSNDINMQGNVNMIAASGNRLLTERITWNNKNKMLETEEPVKIIKSNGDTLEGIGLKADYKLEYYEIKRKVVAVTKKSVDEKTLKK